MINAKEASHAAGQSKEKHIKVWIERIESEVRQVMHDFRTECVVDVSNCQALDEIEAHFKGNGFAVLRFYDRDSASLGCKYFVYSFEASATVGRAPSVIVATEVRETDDRILFFNGGVVIASFPLSLVGYRYDGPAHEKVILNFKIKW